MTALRKYEVTEAEVQTVETVEKTGRWNAVPITPEEHAAAQANQGNPVKNIALFLIAPFIALAYIVAMPIVGLGMLTVLAAKALAKMPAVRAVAMTIAAPFIGLAAIVVMPFAGLGAMAWIGMKAIAKR